MREFSISPLPVIDDQGGLVGLVTEINLLKYLLSSQDSEQAKRPIGELEVVDRSVPSVTPETSLETVMSVFATSPAVIVVASATDEHRAVSILTRIDLLSYLTRQVRPTGKPSHCRGNQITLPSGRLSSAHVMRGGPPYHLHT